jgi:hypothetical protein
VKVRNIIIACVLSRGDVQDYTPEHEQSMRTSATTLAALAANFHDRRTQLLMYNGLPAHGMEEFITEKDSEQVSKHATVRPALYSFLLQGAHQHATHEEFMFKKFLASLLCM